MSETKDENLLAGLTAEVQDGAGLLAVMKHGEEPLDMLLALLNSPLETLLATKQAEILGSANMGGVVGTLIFFHNTLPTGDGLGLDSIGNG